MNAKKPTKRSTSVHDDSDHLEKVQDIHSVTVVVLGASGDLAKRKIYPALFSLMVNGYVPKKWHIVGYARSKLSNADLQSRVKPFLPEKEKDKFDEFFASCSYVSGQYDDTGDFKKLAEYLTKLEEGKSSNRLFYLSLPPNVFLKAATSIGENCRTKEAWNRIVIEKPFGRDSQTFEELSEGLNSVFEQDEIYRIDHYVGKEVVQNLLVLRFANVIFDPLWNRSNIKCIQIIFKEKLGVEGRGGYFDNYGIVRDVMQNHLMQILALVTMEPPVKLTPEDIRVEKIKILKAIAPLNKEDIVIGQYKGRNTLPSYVDDPTVDSESITPTFAATVLKIKNRRWDGVPILMKCGKALDEKCAEIRIQFNDVPANLYTFAKMKSNELVIRIQPDEAIYFKIMNKVVGYSERLSETQLDFTYSKMNKKEIPDAYARLLLDVLQGNQSSFIDEEELRVSWEIFTPILKQLEKNHIAPESYYFGTRGPIDHDYLASKYNVKWSEDK